MRKNNGRTGRQIPVFRTPVVNIRNMKVVAALLSLFLAGCGGDGGDNPFDLSDPDTNTSSNTDADTDTGSGTRTGAPFTGRLLGTLNRFDNTLLGMDLSTGRFTPLVGLSGSPPFDSEGGTDTRRDPSALSAAVLTLDECNTEINDGICFFYLDRDGNVTGGFSISGEFPGPGKMSPDGTHLAVNRSDRAAGLSTMTIYTRDGTLVSNHSQDGPMSSEGPYDWLPDGRLVYSYEQGLFGDTGPQGFIITQPYSAVPDRIITLPSRFDDGRLDTIETSPDGTQLLLNLEMRTGPLRPILVDTETLAIQELFDFNGITDVESIVWGPDGAWTYAVIASSELLSGTALDNSQGGTLVFVGSFESLFAVPVNGVTHAMPESLEDLPSGIQLIPTDSARSQDGEIGAGNYNGNYIWVP